MDEVRIVKHRTHIWPVIIALIVLALVIGYVLFAMNGPSGQVGWNDLKPVMIGAGAPVMTT
jgi:hypothetical protein